MVAEKGEPLEEMDDGRQILGCWCLCSVVENTVVRSGAMRAVIVTREHAGWCEGTKQNACKHRPSCSPESNGF